LLKPSSNDAGQLLAAMNHCDGARQMSQLWSDYLAGSQRVFSKLAAAASGGKCSAWSGRIKNQRKNDELLQYVHQARHADEHGLEAIAKASGRGWGLHPADPVQPLKINKMIVKQGIVEHLDADNAQIVFRAADAELSPRRTKVASMTLRRNILGNLGQANKALAVAQAVQEFMEKTVSEGESYIVE
jgi:hypothetical protein